jgi:hypothetical protein
MAKGEMMAGVDTLAQELQDWLDGKLTLKPRELIERARDRIKAIPNGAPKPGESHAIYDLVAHLRGASNWFNHTAGQDLTSDPAPFVAADFLERTKEVDIAGLNMMIDCPWCSAKAGEECFLEGVRISLQVHRSKTHVHMARFVGPGQWRELCDRVAKQDEELKRLRGSPYPYKTSSRR